MLLALQTDLQAVIAAIPAEEVNPGPTGAADVNELHLFHVANGIAALTAAVAQVFLKASVFLALQVFTHSVYAVTLVILSKQSP